MAMTDYVIRERLPELWRQIDNTHFSYLETDDSPEKLDQRKKLEGYMLDYLCLVPHESKFFLAETGAVLSQSSAADSGFSGYRQARGWAALARYAANLLAQPWRKEYRTIRLYSGFYKHEVEGAGLVGGSSLLRAMGYRGNSSSGTLALDGPVCPDQVAAVSRDSLIAYVECQIMIQIWEEVSVRGGACSWHDVLLCREAGAGDVASAVAALLHTNSGPNDIYCNVKFPTSSPQSNLKQNLIQQQPMPVNNLSHIGNVSNVSSLPHSGQINGHAMQADNRVSNIPTTVQALQQPNGNAFISNGHISNTSKSHAMQSNHTMPMNNHHHNVYCPNPPIQAHQQHQVNGMVRGPLEVNPMYGYNTMAPVNHYGGMPGYYYNPMPPHPYVMQQPIVPFAPVRQATTLPLVNGYHCPVIPQQQFCPSVPTGQLIELDIPNYSNNHSTNKCSNSHHYCPNTVSPKHSHNTTSERNKGDSIQMYKDSHKSHNSGSYDSASRNAYKKSQDMNGENQENTRRNSAPKTSSHSGDHGHHTMPRSDTQPSLSKAREDGMGTFESWDYVFRNLESQGYSKDLGERGNILSPPLERDSKTLGRLGQRDSKRYHQTTMDLEDALHALSLEKNSDEEVYRNAKVNETLLKIKQENEAKAAKASSKRQILADEREKRKSSSYDHASVSPSREPLNVKITDKTRLISKEDAKDKREIDKTTYVNGNSTNRGVDTRKARKSIVKCLSSDADKNTTRRKISMDNSVQANIAPKKTTTVQATISTNHHPPQTSQSLDSTDGLKTRLVVTLRDPEASSHTKPDAGKKLTDGRWHCGTCTFLNGAGRQACEMCGKSKQAGPETLPLMSGGKECPACTLVNQREASVCAACDTSLKHSPTYI